MPKRRSLELGSGSNKAERIARRDSLQHSNRDNQRRRAWRWFREHAETYPVVLSRHLCNGDVKVRLSRHRKSKIYEKDDTSKRQDRQSPTGRSVLLAGILLSKEHQRDPGDVPRCSEGSFHLVLTIPGSAVFGISGAALVNVSHTGPFLFRRPSLNQTSQKPWGASPPPPLGPLVVPPSGFAR